MLEALLSVVTVTLPLFALTKPSILTKLASILISDFFSVPDELSSAYLKACNLAISSLSFNCGDTSVMLFFAKVTIPLRSPTGTLPLVFKLSCANKWIEPFALTEVVAFKVPC